MRAPPLNSHGAILLAGFALAAIGLAYSPAATTAGPLATTAGPQGQGQTTISVNTTPPTFPAMGNANSNNTMIAVTGIDLTGSSVLYLIDTVNRQLAVYQASGGTGSMESIRLVAARRIDLDLQLYGLNDKSEYSFEDLQKRFAESKRTAPPVK